MLCYSFRSKTFNILLNFCLRERYYVLAPGGVKSLKSLGNLYKNDGDFSKREVRNEDITQRSKFLERDKKAFIEYEILDEKFTVKHETEMEKLNKTVRQIGIPITLSSIGRNYVSTQLIKNLDKHLPYQIYGEFLMGNASEIQTPKGLFETRDPAEGYICTITMQIIRV